MTNTVCEPAPKAPPVFTVESLPRTQTGKVRRSELVQHVTARGR